MTPARWSAYVPLDAKPLHDGAEREVEMAVYMVDRNLPGITPEQLAGAQRAAITASERFTAEGRDVRYLRSTFLPDESRCMCLFEAPTRQRVKEVNDAANLPYTRIVEALDLTPE